MSARVGMVLLVVGWSVVIAGVSLSLAPPGCFELRPKRPLGPSRAPDVVEAMPRRGLIGEGVEAIGRRCRRVFGRVPSAESDQRVGSVVVIALACLPLDVRLAMVAGLLAAIRPIVVARRRKQERDRAILRELPEVVDLFTVAIRGGLTMSLAIEAVGRRLSGHVPNAMRDAFDRARLGRRLSDELETIPSELGDAVRPLVRALIAADRYGVSIADSLERIAVDVRIERRRAAEIAARRVPVKLLFPLVFCVLPSFALLTLAPVLASSLESLR